MSKRKFEELKSQVNRYKRYDHIKSFETGELLPYQIQHFLNEGNLVRYDLSTRSYHIHWNYSVLTTEAYEIEKAEKERKRIEFEESRWERMAAHLNPEILEIIKGGVDGVTAERINNITIDWSSI